LILFLDRTVTGFLSFEGGIVFAGVALFGLIGDDEDLFFVFAFEVGGLDGAVPALLALAFVEFADGIDLPNDVAIESHSLLGIQFFFLQHA
jgi:hypothetical protein